MEESTSNRTIGIPPSTSSAQHGSRQNVPRQNVPINRIPYRNRTRQQQGSTFIPRIQANLGFWNPYSIGIYDDDDNPTEYTLKMRPMCISIFVCQVVCFFGRLLIGDIAGAAVMFILSVFGFKVCFSGCGSQFLRTRYIFLWGSLCVFNAIFDGVIAGVRSYHVIAHWDELVVSDSQNYTSFIKETTPKVKGNLYTIFEGGMEIQSGRTKTLEFLQSIESWRQYPTQNMMEFLAVKSAPRISTPTSSSFLAGHSTSNFLTGNSTTMERVSTADTLAKRESDHLKPKGGKQTSKNSPALKPWHIAVILGISWLAVFVELIGGYVGLKMFYSQFQVELETANVSMMSRNTEATMSVSVSAGGIPSSTGSSDRFGNTIVEDPNRVQSIQRTAFQGTAHRL